MIEVKLITFNSKEYYQALGLRYEVLRRPLNLHFQETDLEKEIADTHVAAFLGKRIVGCLILSKIENNSGVLKMRQVAVDQSFQGQGVGKAMVLFSEHLAIENQFEKFELHARFSAVSFYLSMDYMKVGNEFQEVNIPHFKMVKKLNAQNGLKILGYLSEFPLFHFIFP